MYILARPVNKFYLLKVLNHVVKEQTLCTKEGLKQKINIRMLIVDDNEFCRNAIIRIAKQYVSLCSVFGDATEVLLKVKESPYDLAIIDYQMPIMNGIELIKRIRKEKTSMTIIRIQTNNL